MEAEDPPMICTEILEKLHLATEVEEKTKGLGLDQAQILIRTTKTGTASCLFFKPPQHGSTDRQTGRRCRQPHSLFEHKMGLDGTWTHERRLRRAGEMWR